MNPTRLLRDLEQITYFSASERSFALSIIMILRERSHPNKYAKVTRKNLLHSLGLSEESWPAILSILEVLHESGYMHFKVGPRKKAGKAHDLFGEDRDVYVTLQEAIRWFGREKREIDPFEQASKKAAKELEKFGREVPEGLTSKLVENLWKWWNQKWSEWHLLTMGIRAPYTPEHSFTQDVGFIASMASMPKELIYRGAKALLTGQCEKWTEKGRRLFWATGQRNVRCWRLAVIYLNQTVSRWVAMRNAGVADDIYDAFKRDRITPSQAEALFNVAESDPKGAVQMANSLYGLGISPQTAGLRAVPDDVQRNSVNGVIVDKEDVEIEEPSLFDWKHEDSHGNQYLGAERRVGGKENSAPKPETSEGSWL